MSLQVSIDGTTIAGVLQAAITTNNYYSSGSFSLTLAIGPSPLKSTAWWSELGAALVNISYIDEKLDDLSEVITGRIDTVVLNPVYRTVSVEGRDLSAGLIDSYVQQDFVNQTASEILSTLAGRCGLAVEVSPTPGNVGRFFGDGYTKLSLGQFSDLRSNWDLVVQLARAKNYDVFVEGTTLNFQPAGEASLMAIPISAGDVTAMRLERNLTVDSSNRVTVQSWNSQQMSAYNSGGSTPSAVLPDSYGTWGTGYLFSKSNLTSLQTDMYANQYASEVSRLQTVLHMNMPWSLEISPRSVVLLQDTDSSFDGLYQVDCVERHYSSSSGSSQTIRAVSWRYQDNSLAGI
ncbi:hypothetical protein [Rhodopila sp.]|uniref:hypothetical protein n=1 Tax=Rhodopila sp. TaxID=2480087 RepID=UPI003D100C56